MSLEGEQVGLDFVDKSYETVTFPNCPDVKSLFFQYQRLSTIKPGKSIQRKCAGTCRSE